MKTSILFTILLISIRSIAQIHSDQNPEINYDFKTGIPDNIEFENLRPSDKFNGSVQLTNESHLIISKVDNLKEIRFKYQYILNTGTLNFSLQAKKNSQKEYIDIKDITFSTSPINNTDLYEIIVNIPENIINTPEKDEIDIKFSTEISKTSIAELFISNITLLKYSKKEIEEEKQNQFYIDEMKKFQFAQKVSDYNKKLEIVEKKYISNISKLQDISYRSYVLATISRLVVFVNHRNQLSNPTNYTVFNDKIDLVRNNCDEIQKKFLDRLIEDIEPTELVEPNIESRSSKSGFMKVVGILGEVGNVLTGGQFKSVVNSVQGIVSSVFSPQNIENKNPEYKTSTNRKGKIKLIKNSKYSKEKINKLITEGLEVQNFFFHFFDIMKKDREDFSQIVKEFEYYSDNTGNLINTIELARINFFKAIDYTMTEDYYQNNFLQTGNDKIEDLLIISSKYFKKLKIDKNKISTIPPEKIAKLNEIDELNKQIIYISIQYDNYAADLRTLFNKVEQDLNKHNPFGEFKDDNLISKREDLFDNSFDSYENLRKIAKTEFDPLKETLKKVLL